MNKFKLIFAVASLALAMIFTVSCSSDDTGYRIPGMDSFASNRSVFLNSDMVFVKTPIPAGSSNLITGVQFITNSGGSTYGTLIFTSYGELMEMYLQIEGYNGYYVKELSKSDIANIAGSNYAYSVDLDFAPGFDVDQTIKIGGKSKQGDVSSIKESENSSIGRYNCSSNYLSGDYAGFIGSFDMKRNSGSFMFEYNTYSVPDEVTVYDGPEARGTPLHHYPSGGTSGWKTVTVYFTKPTITVKVIGSSSGTAWDFIVNCP